MIKVRDNVLQIKPGPFVILTNVFCFHLAAATLSSQKSFSCVCMLLKWC